MTMQQIIRGIEYLPILIKSLNCKKFLLVVDESFPFLSIKKSIDSLDIHKVVFNEFTPNPLYEQVCKGLELFTREGCDGILSIGGGSCIDVAKCIKLAAIAEAGKNCLIPPLVSKETKTKVNESIPLIAVPTTAGTGAESTHNAVIYYQGAKQTVTSDSILPDIALLEPSVLATLPLYQKKCTMMDALCQGIESWWSVNSSEESRGYSRRAVELIISHWRNYIFHNDREAMCQIMEAANLSGRAINLAQTTAAHAMSYKITSLYKLPHGHAVAVCLPEIWDYMHEHPENCIDHRGVSHVFDIFQEIAHSMDTNDVSEAILLFRKMMSLMKLGNPVSSIERTSELELLSNSVNPERVKNNPIKIDKNTALDLYKKIVKAS